jgi:hypothetical protein
MDKYYWVDANGSRYAISDNHLIKSGPDGRYMPPISFVEDEVPFLAGTRLRTVKIGPREFDLTIYIDGDSEVDVRNKTRNLLRTFNPVKGDGKISVVAADNSQREINCRYAGGLEISEKEGSKIGNIQTVTLVFRAFDPYWYDTATKVQTFKINESPGTFFPLAFPIRVASSTVFADITIDNTGDVETWPEWIVTGPGEDVVIRNLTTGEVTNLDVSLDVGETITIDTKPFHKTVTKNDGTNLFYLLSDDSSLWALQDGVNSVQIEMGSATVDSNIQLSYRNRYWGP